MKHFGKLAAIVSLGALASCTDERTPLTVEVPPAYSTDDNVTGSEASPHDPGTEATTTSTDTTIARGPGTYGSGH